MPATAVRWLRLVTVIGFVLAIVGSPEPAFSQEDREPGGKAETTIAPPTHLTAKDHPNDNGKAIDLKWQLSPDDTPDKRPRTVRGYVIYRTIAEPDKIRRDQNAAPREGVRVAF